MMILGRISRPAESIIVLCGAEAGFVPRPSARQKIRNVTICNGTDCKLYGVVREGELLGHRGRTFAGTAVECGKGESKWEAVAFRARRE